MTEVISKDTPFETWKLADLKQRLDDVDSFTSSLHTKWLAPISQFEEDATIFEWDFCNLIQELNHVCNSMLTNYLTALKMASGVEKDTSAQTIKAASLVQEYVDVITAKLGELLSVIEPVSGFLGSSKVDQGQLFPASCTSDIFRHVTEVLHGTKLGMEQLHKELEECKFLQWLETAGDVAEEAATAPRKSATTAFWRGLVARYVKVFGNETPGIGGLLPSTVVDDDAVSDLGHVVDATLAAFPDGDSGLLALLHVLPLCGWKVNLRTSVAESPLGKGPWLMVTTPRGTQLLIDPAFREKFLAAKQSPRLARLLQSLPAAFVGTPMQLVQSVRWCGSVLQESFQKLGMTLPPWRTSKHLLEFYARFQNEDTAPLQARLHWALQRVHQNRPSFEGTAKLHDIAEVLLDWIKKVETPSGDQGPAAAAGIALGRLLSREAAMTFIHELQWDACEVMHDFATASAVDFEKIEASPRESLDDESDEGPGPSYLTQLLDVQQRSKRRSPLQHHVPMVP